MKTLIEKNSLILIEAAIVERLRRAGKSRRLVEEVIFVTLSSFWYANARDNDYTS